MMSEELNEILRHNLQLNFDHMFNDSDLIIEDLGADSLNIVEIIMEIESEFDIDIDDNEIENIKTVGDLKKLIQDLS
jgi:acyl carrier protein